MNEAGVLGKLIPEFRKIVAMMQFNMYHHYTVDEHLIRCIGVLSEIERGDGAEIHPLSHTLMPDLKRRREVLYVAVLLHDIAKGRPEDHSTAGARIARRLCPHMGFNAADTETIAWLVENHLVMSMTAQTRDLNDRKTIQDFADVVQSVERLKLLLILTVCDIRGVGPGVWNGWKGQLLRTLYYETELLLTGGFSEVSRAKRAEIARGQLARCARRLVAGGRAPLCRAALRQLSADRRSGGPAPPCRLHPRDRQGRAQAGDDGEDARIRGGDGDHHPVARPSAPALGDRGRLRGGGRQHRRRADLHDDRRARARHDPDRREFDRDEDELRRARRVGSADRGRAVGQELAAGDHREARQAQARRRRPSGSSRASTCATRCPTGFRSIEVEVPRPAGPACRRSPARSRTCRSTSPRRTSPPSARR